MRYAWIIHAEEVTKAVEDSSTSFMLASCIHDSFMISKIERKKERKRCYDFLWDSMQTPEAFDIHEVEVDGGGGGGGSRPPGGGESEPGGGAGAMPLSWFPWASSFLIVECLSGWITTITESLLLSSAPGDDGLSSLSNTSGTSLVSWTTSGMPASDVTLLGPWLEKRGRKLSNAES